MIIGIDEVGRGAWAGPLVVGACLLPDDAKIEGLTDSKKLTAKRRLVLEQQIKNEAIAWGLGWVSSTEIDQIGLTEALKQASYQAISQIKANYNKIIIDGTLDFLADWPEFKCVSTLKKADLLVPSVSAAAILAKVARDNYMIELADDEKYANYSFDNHVGYGTAAHRRALEKFGVSDQHRRSFKPIAKLLGETEDKDISGTTKAIGNWGEQVVKEYLLAQNYQFLVANWKTRQFEIDLVMEKDKIIYLVEVKTRKNSDFGGGLGAINNFKRRKLELAAQAITQKYPDKDVAALAIIITGNQANYQLEVIDLEF